MDQNHPQGRFQIPSDFRYNSLHPPSVAVNWSSHEDVWRSVLETSTVVYSARCTVYNAAYTRLVSLTSPVLTRASIPRVVQTGVHLAPGCRLHTCTGIHTGKPARRRYANGMQNVIGNKSEISEIQHYKSIRAEFNVQKLNF